MPTTIASFGGPLPPLNFQDIDKKYLVKALIILTQGSNPMKLTLTDPEVLVLARRLQSQGMKK